MVELKDDRIGLAAIDAGMIAEVDHEKDESLFKLGFLSPGCSVDVALFVRLVMLAVVLGAAGPAVSLPLPSRAAVPREFLVRLYPFCSASIAS
jgi:hypothetical protein